MTESAPIEAFPDCSPGATGPLPQDLQEIAVAIHRAAQDRDGNSVALLALLRLLEQCHRDICETQFRNALPSNRHTLYTLLRDIEVHGGWPYIQRMKLRALLANVSSQDIWDGGEGPIANPSSPPCPSEQKDANLP